MKTSIIMQRDLNGVPIRQDSKSGFFNANDLLNLYSAKNKTDKRIEEYLSNKTTKEFMAAIINDILQNNGKSSDLQIAAGESPKQALDKLVVQSKRGKNGGTWMETFLFMDFAAWLSPEFKLQIYKWAYDNVIKYRIEAGDEFKEVNETLFRIKPNRGRWDYANEARMINKLVFNSPESGQRNSASEPELALLRAMQKADCKLIEQGLDYFDRIKKLEEYKSAYLIMSV